MKGACARSHFVLCSAYVPSPPSLDLPEADMSASARQIVRNPTGSAPARAAPAPRSPGDGTETPRRRLDAGAQARGAAESAEGARRRMEDPAYRVEVDRRRGRGSAANPSGRFEPHQREA